MTAVLCSLSVAETFCHTEDRWTFILNFCLLQMTPRTTPTCSSSWLIWLAWQLPLLEKEREKQEMNVRPWPCIQQPVCPAGRQLNAKGLVNMLKSTSVGWQMNLSGAGRWEPNTTCLLEFTWHQLERRGDEGGRKIRERVKWRKSQDKNKGRSLW